MSTHTETKEVVWDAGRRYVNKDHNLPVIEEEGEFIIYKNKSGGTVHIYHKQTGIETEHSICCGGTLNLNVNKNGKSTGHKMTFSGN